MADKAPEDEMFKGRSAGKTESFARAHKQGGSMHKKRVREKMAEHRKESKR